MNLRAPRHFIAVLSAVTLLTPLAEGASAAIDRFVSKNCVECHDADSKKGDLDLTVFKFDLANTTNFSEWVKVHDRVASGEMPPPKKKERPNAKDLQAFTNELSTALTTADRAQVAREGRATERRLNRYEYEETLRDLLSLPYLDVKELLPEDRESHGFNKIGD